MNLSLIEIRSYCDEFKYTGLVPQPYIAKYFNRGLLRKFLKCLGIYYSTIYFLKDDYNKYLGGVVLRKKPNFIRFSFTWWIYNVYMREEFRGKGFGEALLIKTYEILLKKDIKRDFLKADKLNKVAIKLYTKLGFIKYKENNYDIVMVKELIHH